VAPLANPAPPPPELPIALARNGREFHITGSQSTVRAGTEIEVKTERPKVTLSVSEMDRGSWDVFQLPGFATAASGKEQASLDALRKANQTSYFRDGNILWVKLVVTEAPRMPIRPLDIQASIAVSRGQAVAAGTATGAGAIAVGKS
jgi:cell migration-inducing and hyaluronan-binding protein